MQLKTPIILPNGNSLEYKTAAENIVEVELLDDDFSDKIVGDGYQLDVDLTMNPE